MATFCKRKNDAGDVIGIQVKIRREGFPAQSKTFGGRSAMKDAREWAAEIEARMKLGSFADQREARALTIKEGLERYLAEVTPTKKGARQERQRIATWLNHRIADFSLANLSGKEITVWMKQRLAGGASASTVRNELTILSHLYTVAVKRWGISIPSNPCRAVQYPTLGRARDRRLQGDEYDRLLTACGKCESRYVGLAVTWAVETAMRQGETLGLTWRDIDLVNRTATLVETKNGSGRVVPLSKRALAVLGETETLQPDRKPSDRLFPLTPAALYQSFIKACRRAGIEDLTYHDLRHEATSRLVENPKLKESQIMKITGHKDWGMFQRYHNMRASELADALD